MSNLHFSIKANKAMVSSKTYKKNKGEMKPIQENKGSFIVV